MEKYSVCGVDVKEIQNKIFEIFLEFDKICKKYNLTYTLEGGTLLGAVLHKGFIPWDDDMDIIMPRKDYNKFREIANMELPSKFVFEDMSINPKFPFLFGKCYNKETIYMEKNTEHLDIPHGIWLDIFIEDNIKKASKRIHSRMVSMIGTVRYIKLKVIKFKLKHIFYLPLFLLSIKKLNRLAEKVMTRHMDKETEYIYPLCQSISSKPPLPRRMITDFESAIFNGFEVKIPTCHMWYLHKHYDTPMEIPSIEKRKPGHAVLEIKL